MHRVLRWYDMISINIYYTGLTTLSQTMTPLVVPLLVQQFVGESQQGAYYGTIRLWSLMVALLVQSLMGLLSDRSASKWGKRRPFIFLGTLANMIILSLIGFSASLDGMSGYWVLFFLLILMMFAANTAHGAVQGLIPDLVPEDQRGKYSGVKALLEVPIPLIIVSFTIGRLISNGQMWAALLVCMGILLATMIMTMFAPEKPLETAPEALDWSPFLRLVLMTSLFTAVILSMGWLVKFLGSQVKFSSNTNLIISMGVLGLFSMAIAIGIGVYFSVGLSIGPQAKQNPNFTWWVVNRLAFLVGSTNLASFAVYFLQGRLGLDGELAAKPASQLLLVVGVFILILVLPSGWLADRFGRKPLLAISGLIASLGTLVLILANHMTLIYTGGVLVGAATGLFYSANWALGTDLAPKDQAGRYLGISNLAGAGAGAIGAYIGGPIADLFTKYLPGQPGFGYVVLFAIYGSLFLFSVFVLSKIKIQPIVVIADVE